MSCVSPGGDGLAAPLHAHFACYKVDLDVRGAANSFENTHFRVGKPAGVPGLDAYDTSTSKARPCTRRASAAAWPPPPMAACGGPSTRTPRCAPTATPAPLLPLTGAPGYTIIPGPTTVQALPAMPASHPMVRPTAFTKYTLAVARRKEEEPRALSVYDLWGLVDQPQLDFDSLLDGEPLEGEDLVA